MKRVLTDIKIFINVITIYVGRNMLEISKTAIGSSPSRLVSTLGKNQKCNQPFFLKANVVVFCVSRILFDAVCNVT